MEKIDEPAGGNSAGSAEIFNSFDYQEMSRYNEKIGKIVSQLEDQSTSLVSCSTESTVPNVDIEKTASIDEKAMKDVMDYLGGLM